MAEPLPAQFTYPPDQMAKHDDLHELVRNRGRLTSKAHDEVVGEYVAHLHELKHPATNIVAGSFARDDDKRLHETFLNTPNELQPLAGMTHAEFSHGEHIGQQVRIRPWYSAAAGHGALITHIDPMLGGHVRMRVPMLPVYSKRELDMYTKHLPAGAKKFLDLSLRDHLPDESEKDINKPQEQDELRQRADGSDGGAIPEDYYAFSRKRLRLSREKPVHDEWLPEDESNPTEREGWMGTGKRNRHGTIYTIFKYRPRWDQDAANGGAWVWRAHKAVKNVGVRNLMKHFGSKDTNELAKHGHRSINYKPLTENEQYVAGLKQRPADDVTGGEAIPEYFAMSRQKPTRLAATYAVAPGDDKTYPLAKPQRSGSPERAPVWTDLMGNRAYSRQEKSLASRIADKHLDRFALRHGYNDRNAARQHLTAMVLRAHQEFKRTGDREFQYKHPTSGKTIKFVKPTVQQYKPGMQPPTRLARKPVNPDEEGFKGTIWKQWQEWRKHIADNERRGRPDLYHGAPPIMDDNARLAFADYLEEKGNPLAPVVRGHVEKHYYQLKDDNDRTRLSNHRNFGRHPESMHKGNLYWYDAIGIDQPPFRGHGDEGWNFEGDLIHPGQTTENLGDSSGKDRPLPSVVWRHKGVTTSRMASGTSRFREHPVMFHAPVTTSQFFAIADSMPKAKRAHWERYAAANGWERPAAKPTKLARMPDRKSDTGSAMAAAGSTNHKARLRVVKTLLREAGLTPATVRAALAHDGANSRQSFASVIKKAVHPDHVKYAAAWLGLMSGEKRLAVVQPDADGEDLLHVIKAPGPPDSLASLLREAGVDRFTSEQTASGSRAYILNPRGKYPIEKVAGSIPNARHSSTRVRVYRIGSGASSAAAGGQPTGTDADARAAYRSVIDGFERAAGASEG